MKGWQNQYDYGFRIYDPRIGRFLSVDPISRSYPMLTPYQYASNSPIKFKDIDGLEAGLDETMLWVRPDDTEVRRRFWKSPIGNGLQWSGKVLKRAGETAAMTLGALTNSTILFLPISLAAFRRSADFFENRRSLISCFGIFIFNQHNTNAIAYNNCEYTNGFLDGQTGKGVNVNPDALNRKR